MTAYIRDFYPERAQYRTGEPVGLVLELENKSCDAVVADVEIGIADGDRLVGNLSRRVTLQPGVSSELRVTVGPYETAWTGYGADATLTRVGGCDAEGKGSLSCEVGGSNNGGFAGGDGPAGDTVLSAAGATAEAASLTTERFAAEMRTSPEAAQTLSTAFDVVDDWRRATRYGFLSDFAADDADDSTDVAWMAKLHLNLVQYYDWMYRHDELVGPADIDSYIDLMGRRVDRAAVRAKIAACHEYGMRAIAYGAVYAASRAFADRHPDWCLYTSGGEPYDFIGIFRIMNIAPDSPWSAHIAEQYRDSVERLGFDGIHMDTYGFPKTAWSRLDNNWRLERLGEQFPALIERARETLAPVHADPCLILNNVGNWPVDTVGPAPQDAMYIEVWSPYDRYRDLAGIIEQARQAGRGKCVILAAYLKPFREPCEQFGESGAECALRLLSATVGAHGAYHLLAGEYGGVLTQGYYVDHSKLRPGFLRTVRDYADFAVRYAHLTHDPDLRDVSRSHTDGDNLEYVFAGFASSPSGEAGRVWTVIREKPGRKLIHFINLSGMESDRWNEGHPEPQPVSGRMVRVLADETVTGAYISSPDINQGRPLIVAYRLEHSERGQVAVFEHLPELRYWDLLVLTCEERAPM